jgi:hypothetical protein
MIIPLRAMTHPPVNRGNAVTFSRFWWLVSGGEYQSYYLQFTLPEILEGIRAGATGLLEQFGLAGVVLGLVSLVVFGTPSRLYILTAWTAIVHAVFVVFYRSADSYVYLIPMYMSFAVWIGLSLPELSGRISQKFSILRLGLCLVVIGYFISRSSTYFGLVDASRDSRAVNFGRAVLSAVPPNAIVFAEGDEAVFTLWYFHIALEQRPDIAVLAVDLLHFDWYQENLRSSYPSLIVPPPFPWPETIVGANPSRPVCRVRYSESTEMDCSPPVISR